MWIRTQDRKRLVDCKDIDTMGVHIYENQIDGVIALGEYPTESRALEVLDEIQENIDLNRYETQPVYEMPKD